MGPQKRGAMAAEAARAVFEAGGIPVPRIESDPTHAGRARCSLFFQGTADYTKEGVKADARYVLMGALAEQVTAALDLTSPARWRWERYTLPRPCVHIITFEEAKP